VTKLGHCRGQSQTGDRSFTAPGLRLTNSLIYRSNFDGVNTTFVLNSEHFERLL